MRNLGPLEPFRLRGKSVLDLWGWEGDHTCGAFNIPSPIDKQPLRVMVSSDRGWDHVSVSRPNRCPNWPEMEHIARLFFCDDETAMQLHVPIADHVNMHAYCLHWWRPHDVEIPRPPAIFVGIGNTPARDADEAKARVLAALG